MSTSPQPTNGSPTDSPGPLRVLVVDDQELNRMVAEVQLRQLGCESRLVGGGEEAVRTVEREAFHLVLMDIQMPGISGLEATRRIRALREAPARPFIVAYTAYPDAENRRACREVGMDGFLAKPLRKTILRAQLVELGLLTEEEPATRRGD